jgi:hypothetical protein
MTQSLSKNGMGEILQSVIKIPLYPPLGKGELKCEDNILKGRIYE